MRNKMKRWIRVLVACCIAICLMPTLSACDEQEEFDQDLSEQADEQTQEENTSSSSNLFDYILERYPLLNDIIEMILDLLYNWILNLYTGTYIS